MYDDFLTRVSDQTSSVAQWPGEDTGVTGRVSILANVFSTINGYDQDLPNPTGYQDIEIMKRASFCMNEQEEVAVTERQRIFRIRECVYALTWVRRLFDVYDP